MQNEEKFEVLKRLYKRGDWVSASCYCMEWGIDEVMLLRGLMNDCGNVEEKNRLLQSAIKEV